MDLKSLLNRYKKSAISRNDLIYLLHFFFNMEETTIYSGDFTVNLPFLDNIMQKYSEHVPVNYLTHHAEFYGLNFYVDERVLIPRPETEELVQYVLSHVNNKQCKILDMCSGSGCIGITLKKHLKDSEISLVDISKGALEVSYENSVLLDAPVKLIESDCFNRVDEKFDIIVSNPPYLKTSEQLDDFVLGKEPSIALFGGENGLSVITRILIDFPNHITNDFEFMIMEISPLLVEDIKQLFEIYLKQFTIEFIKDINGKDRFLLAKLV